MPKAQVRIDEFAFVLLAGILFLLILMMFWGIPEAPPLVEPAFLRRVVRNGTIERFSLTIWGNTTLTDVRLEAKGDVVGWISFGKNYFDVPMGRREVVPIELRIPSDAEGTYRGEILVSSMGGNASVPVEIYVITLVEELATRRFYIGDVEVAYLRESEVLDSKQGVGVRRGYFVDVKLSLLGLIEERKLQIVKKAELRLVIEDTNQAGSLMIYFNDEPIYDEPTPRGEIVVPISLELLRRSNRVLIRAGTPGWMFWLTTFYNFRLIELRVWYDGLIPYEFEFSLMPEEMKYFEHGWLTFLVEEAGRGELVVELNDQLIYRAVPAIKRVTQRFGKEVVLRELNLLRFEAEPVGIYRLSEAMLVISYWYLPVLPS